jgi:hypothetical protein
MPWPFWRGKPLPIAPGAYRVRFLAARDSVDFPFCVRALPGWPDEFRIDSPIDSTHGRPRS